MLLAMFQISTANTAVNLYANETGAIRKRLGLGLNAAGLKS